MQDFANAIGWAEIITQMLSFLAVTVVVPFAIAMARKYLNLKIDDKTRAYVEAAVSAGIRHGVNAAANGKKLSVNEVISQTVSDPEMRIAVVGAASDYLNRTVPDGLARLGITGEQVTELAYTRVDKALNAMSSDVQGTFDSTASAALTKASGLPSPQLVASAGASG